MREKCATTSRFRRGLLQKSRDPRGVCTYLRLRFSPTWRAPTGAAAAARGDNYIPPAVSVWALSSMPILILGRS